MPLFDVDVDVYATVRVDAVSESDALDKAEQEVGGRLGLTVHSVSPTLAMEVEE